MKRLARIEIDYVFIPPVVFPMPADILLRGMGRRSWATAQVAIKVDSGGRFFTADPAPGYMSVPGASIVTLPDGFTLKATHLESPLGVTLPVGAAAADRHFAQGIQMFLQREAWLE